MKRRMGFLGPLKIISKPNVKEQKPPVREEELDDEPPSPIFIDRPPPLDSRTESELRKSCAVILQDLKPSGHDVEDTRMKSDILLDEYDAQRDSHRRAPPPPISKGKTHSAAAWVINSDVANTRSVNPRSVVRTEDANPPVHGTLPPPPNILSQRSASTGSQSPKLESGYFDRGSPYLLSPTDLQLAPVSSMVNASRSALASPAHDLFHAHRPRDTDPVDSSDTVSSSIYSGSPEQPASASTTMTSTRLTPPSISTRASDQVYSDSFFTEGAAAASAWMKEEVERRMAAQEAQASKAVMGSSRMYRTDGEQSMSQVTVGDMSRPPGTTRSANPRPAYTQKQAESSRLKPLTIPAHRQDGRSGYDGSNGVSPVSARPEKGSDNRSTSLSSHKSDAQHSGRQKDSRPGSSRSLQNESRRTTDATPRAYGGLTASDYDIPPVPQLHGYREDQTRFGSKPVSSPSTPIAESSNFAQRRLSGDVAVTAADTRPTNVDEAFDETLRTQIASLEAGPGPTVEAPALAAEAEMLSSRTEKAREMESQGTLRASKHQDDETVLVKDFWSPSAWAPRNNQHQPSGPAARDFGLGGFDFDGLMSVMRDSTEVTEAAYVRDHDTQLLHGANPSSSNNHPADLGANDSSRGAASPAPAFASGSFTPQQRTQTPNGHRTNGDSRTNGSFSDRSESRAGTTSPPSRPTTSLSETVTPKKEPRGIKKLLHRLGGGDMPTRRLVYIPPPEERRSGNGQGEGGQGVTAQDWQEEEACAAPVIGFGGRW